MIRYLNGNKEADEIIEALKERNQDEDGPLAILEVKGDGPFRRQIERMAEGTGIDVIEGAFSKVCATGDLDVVNDARVREFFTRPSVLLQPPCAVQAIEALLPDDLLKADANIIVLGRGRFGAFAATYLVRWYDRITWQSASEPIESPGIIINCSRKTPERYPDGSAVIDINKIGRLTTAILLWRAADCGDGEIELV